MPDLPAPLEAACFSAALGRTVAGRYRLDAFLAHGAFGGVFRASHLAYGTLLRPVALKVSRRPMAESEARHAFADALLMARVADSVTDPLLRQHFVTVHDAGLGPAADPFPGHPYLVMELVPGPSLDQALRRGPFPLARAVACFDQLLRAVAFLHRPDTGRGPLIHRDLKPANILLTRAADGADVVKLTDFGCARELHHLLAAVESGGDLAFLAPESFTHDANTPRSDVYMLGLILHEMLTGRHPFREVGVHLRGDSPAARDELRRLHLLARQQETFPGLDALPELASRPRLRQLIRSLLHEDPRLRPFPDAGALRQAWPAVVADAGPGRGPGPGPGADSAPASPESVARLVAAAEQCYRAGDDPGGDALLERAQRLNRDPRQTPDHQVHGRAYLLAVRRLLARGDLGAAGTLATEGYHRRPTRDTGEAMALYCHQAGNPDLADHFRAEARKLPPGPS